MTAAAPPGRLTRAGAVALLIAMALGAALIGRAMSLYPGGSVVDRFAAGHSFWFNFLCDLTAPAAVNGTPNLAGAALARHGMLALSIALGLFWLILPTTLPARRTADVALRVAGVIAAVGFGTVPFATGPLHAIAIFASVVPGLVATVLGLAGLLAKPRRAALVVLVMGAIVAGVADAVLYAEKVTGRLSGSSPLVPLAQRAAVLLLLAWMGTVAWAVLRAPARRRAPAGNAPGASARAVL